MRSFIALRLKNLAFQAFNMLSINPLLGCNSALRTGNGVVTNGMNCSLNDSHKVYRAEIDCARRTPLKVVATGRSDPTEDNQIQQTIMERCHLALSGDGISLTSTTIRAKT